VISTANTWDARLVGNRGNAFDVMRLALATLVVLEHSYFLIDGTFERDPLFVISRGQLNCGQFAVYMFFSLSGYLVTRSLIEGPGVTAFLMRRIGRIVPGFLVASAAGCLIVGPLTATGNITDYLRSQNWALITANALALKQVAVTNVLGGNPLDLVHGTLWSIRYEFDCYLLLALLGLFRLLRSPRVTFVVLVVTLGISMVLQHLLPVIDHGVVSFVMSSPHRWPDLFAFFFCGSAFFMFRASIPKSGALFALAAVLLFASLFAGNAYWAALFCGTYAILFASLSFAADFRLFGRRVDLSYGVYLYGWPVQQLLLFDSKMSLSPLWLFTISLGLTSVVAFMSWKVVERPSLLLVRKFERRWEPACDPVGFGGGTGPRWQVGNRFSR
jgi:peptidoglycan/LPS O-acetylase OafA/YrhL